MVVAKALLKGDFIAGANFIADANGARDQGCKEEAELAGVAVLILKADQEGARRE